jgi:hypothetical protein
VSAAPLRGPVLDLVYLLLLLALFLATVGLVALVDRLR